MASRAIFVFPPFRLNAANEQLWRDSNLVDLRPKTFEVLVYLVQHARRLVTKRELLDSVWAGASVSDELLRGYIRACATRWATMPGNPVTSKRFRRVDIASCLG